MPKEEERKDARELKSNDEMKNGHRPIRALLIYLYTSPRALSYYYMITMQHDLIRHLNKILKGADLIVYECKHMNAWRSVHTNTRFNRFVKEIAENNNCFGVYALFWVVHAFFRCFFHNLALEKGKCVYSKQWWLLQCAKQEKCS